LQQEKYPGIKIVDILRVEVRLFVLSPEIEDRDEVEAPVKYWVII
jgi:hypothetical protein